MIRGCCQKSGDNPKESGKENNRVDHELLVWGGVVLILSFAFLIFYSFKVTQNISYSYICLALFFITGYIFIENINI